MSETPATDWYQDDFEGCWKCGGEGFVWDCIDGCCLDAEAGCDMCTSRCEICSARSPASASEEKPGASQ